MLVQKEYGAYVDWEERFYNCHFCDEPVYEEDWEDDELDKFLCPICEDYDRD
jgi:formylmethanofuran dehydrogenase subunit E